ncbi:MAG: RNA polymerase sporulation sigma factor SigH [Clostridia bacterium]|nr:RNA polymerase sporulation sigma factor SigH [Clostridia bacterium]
MSEQKLSPYASMTDEEIVTLAQKADKKAVEYILEKYKGLVKARARAYFLIGADAEDLIQEGMIGLYKAIRDFNKEKQVGFAAFADICTTRQIVTAVKTATRQKHIPLNNYVSLNKPVSSDDSEKTMLDYLSENLISDPEQIVINQESYDSINKKIGSILSDFELRVLELYLSGRSYQEIADTLDKSAKSIDNALQRTKRKIEEGLMQKQL